MVDDLISRHALTVEGQELSYLHAGEGSPLLLLHGTYWSRVWKPVIPRLAQNHEVFAFDYPGFGRSGGRLAAENARVPRLAELILRAADMLEVGDTFFLAGHDIGGAVAQHITAFSQNRVRKLALVNSVLYDSWPVPRVARFRDPKVARNVTPEELIKLRREALGRAVKRGLSSAEEEGYLSPWRSEDATRSWMALAAAADSRYTMELVEPLQRSGIPILLVWGEEDKSQPIEYARRFAREFHQAHLVAVPGASHIPMEDNPEMVGATLAGFFAEVRKL
jgi:pimeloyl-ACP methyl ester carboxylesterase